MSNEVGRRPGDDPGSEDAAADVASSRSRPHRWRELAIIGLVALGLAVLIKTFLVQVFVIDGESMSPTVHDGYRVLISRVTYDLRDIDTGDTVVFENPGAQEPDRNPAQAFLHWLTGGLGLTRPSGDDLIKRVIGLPGDLVESHGGRVYMNGHVLDEPWLPDGTTTAPFPPHRVSAGTVFVMGDNRGSSFDSSSGLGDVPKDRIIGEAVLVIWPLGRIGGLG